MRKKVVVKKKKASKEVEPHIPAAQQRITASDMVGITADVLQDCYIYPEPSRANAEDVAISITRMVLYEEGGTKVTNHIFKGRECGAC